jgi:hypothetical protein
MENVEELIRTQKADKNWFGTNSSSYGGRL